MIYHVLFLSRNCNNLGVIKDKRVNRYCKDFGAALRKIRETKGWTLEETEDHGFHDWKYLQYVESGRNVTLATLLKLSDLYKVEPWELLKGVKK